MLTELSIRDIALIPRLRVRLGGGLNVLSGETGAGKSLIVGSLRLLCGERAGPELVRAGAERGVVEGIFELDPHGWIARELTALGINVEEGELILRREIAASGKGRVRANGMSIPRSTLQRAAESLIDLHGQHQHQSLLRPAYQREVLDECARLAERRENFARTLAAWKESAAELARLEAAAQRARESTQLARFQLRELEEAGPRPGELKELAVERGRLEQAELLRLTGEQLLQRLAEAENSLQDELYRLAGAAEQAASHDENWGAVARALEGLAITTGEIATEARSLGERAIEDPERLAWVRERIRTLEDLLHKYGPEEGDLFALWERLRAQEADPNALQRRREALRRRVGEISDTLMRLGRELTVRRKRAAARLGREVERVLGQLGMEGTSFEARIAPRSEGAAFRGPGSPERAGPDGLDAVEFRLSPNLGEEARKLRAIASGGEISRVMLALKSILGHTRGTATMAFDEIDIGVGGSVAARVAETLAAIARDRQVICITHLARIASRADVHLRVWKEEHEGRTVTLVERVEGERRVREIARMLGGPQEGIAAEHARELLREAVL